MMNIYLQNINIFLGKTIVSLQLFWFKKSKIRGFKNEGESKILLIISGYYLYIALIPKLPSLEAPKNVTKLLVRLLKEHIQRLNLVFIMIKCNACFGPYSIGSY